MKKSGVVLVGFAVLLVVGLAVKYFYDRFTSQSAYTPDQLLDLVLHNPKKARSYAHAIYEEAVKAISSEPDARKKDELIKQYEKKCPIFALGECVDEGFGPCLLSRDYDPRFREYFESAVVAAVTEKIKPGNTINYVGFGAGGMFQDLVIVAKLLDKNPAARININLIDQKFWCFKDNFDVKEVPQEVLCQVPLQRSRGRQVIQFLQKMFPKAVLSLSFYVSTDEYLKHADDTKSYPDVITAADIEDETSLLARSFFNYGKLCLLSQKKNPAVINILLSKGEDFMTPSIVTFSLNEIAGVKPENAAGKLDYDKTIERVWAKTTKI